MTKLTEWTTKEKMEVAEDVAMQEGYDLTPIYDLDLPEGLQGMLQCGRDVT